ncbi:MAG: hypothetical protein LKI92_01005 [Schleiferilactobacillus harbinensis]|nr:hypothetical protein [Schleiferilactobacillus harbinensis]MCI1912138.1 hypothetical protein [Schleiferilactobacillus harbinensis]
MVKRLRTSKQDVWDSFFKAHRDTIMADIDKKGMYTVTAQELSNVSHALTGPDVRILTKFDRSSQLPDVFKVGASSLSEYINILPLGSVDNNYTYALGHFNAYSPLTYDKTQKPVFVPFPDVQTIRPDTINSENTYIDAAFTSGMIDQAFQGTDKDPLMPVMHGRMGTESMSFYVGKDKKIPIRVDKAQMEIDATFENRNSVVVIEAKAVPEVDFLVRQLYYPYYVIKMNRGVTKPIIPTFLILLGGSYYFVKYEFSDPKNYSSIHKIEQKTFRFDDKTKITYDEVVALVSEIQPVEEPKVPFPQADSYVQCISTLAFLFEENTDEGASGAGLSASDIAASLGVDKKGYDKRQGHYYGDLLVYLGLAQIAKDGTESGLYSISQEGKSIYQILSTSEGRKRMVERLFQHVPFREAFNTLKDREQIFTDAGRLSGDIYEQVATVIERTGSIWNTKTKSFGVSDSTLIRRSQTVVALLRSFIYAAIHD